VTGPLSAATPKIGADSVSVGGSWKPAGMDRTGVDEVLRQQAGMTSREQAIEQRGDERCPRSTGALPRAGGGGSITDVPGHGP
jgi:hypothetical protein